VKFHRHTITKKAFSILLVALMLFINGVKLFHTHAVNPQYTPSGKSAISSIAGDAGQVKQNDHCTICDFQLVRDADVSQITIIISPVQQAAVICAAHLPVCLLTFPITSSGRAPPALA
jgi:hypothetical protein